MFKSNGFEKKRPRKHLLRLTAVLWLALGLLLTACAEQNTPISLGLATTAPATTAPATTSASATTSAATTTATGTTAAATTAPAATAPNATTAAPGTTSGTTSGTTAAGSPAATGGASSDVPTVKVPDSARQQIQTIISQTEKTRNLTFKTPVETNFMTRADLTKYQTDEFYKDNPTENVTRDEKILKAFGFAPKSFSYAQTYIDLLNEQVIGFYDPRTKKLYIVSDTDPSKVDALSRFTAEHELTHALQDQYFDLQKFSPERQPSDQEWSDDASVAKLALIEGDAVQSQLNWIAGGNMNQTDLQELIKSSQDSSSKVLDNAPLILSESLLFPYNEGNAFVKALYDKGGWDMVNKAFTDYPPKSTSQVLHFTKYQNKVEPVKVTLPSMVDVLGSGWKSLDINTNGELSSRIWLQTGMANPKDAAAKTQATNAVKGWAGDRYQALENGQGQTGFVWLTQWESDSAATDFYTAASGSMPRLFNLNGSGTGTDLKKSWSTADQDLTLVRKGNQVLVVALPKGAGVDKVTARLGF
ncbi:MAG: hypothetical protein J0I20_21180 [Chloroflexi bacterium]|nr:hypothetical protein [Chloroflexota bacterium]OJV96534.1 MAG: hypothetical protein BGO39_09740 [Chloroflexi bacterium 54-19]